MTGTSPRIAGAPISWGVCEVPDWGYQLPLQRVLGEMRQLGLGATEFGPPGFLPESPSERAELLASYGLQAVGGFLPLVLHDPAADPEPAFSAYVDECLATGARTVVLAAHTGREGYDAKPILDAEGWNRMLGALERLDRAASARGVTAALHPHLGTMIEGPDEIARVVDGCGIGVCVDTGHMLAGGTDPVGFAQHHAERVRHIHLKDVRDQVAEQLRRGRLTYLEAVRAQLYVPLGEGDVDFAGMITAMTQIASYDGWYVLEQDVALGADPGGAGPVSDVARSLRYLTGLLR